VSKKEFPFILRELFGDNIFVVNIIKKQVRFHVIGPVALILIGLFYVLVLMPTDPVIKGRFIIEPGKNARDITIEMMVSRYPETHNFYKLSFSDKGFFAVKVKERGEHELSFWLENHTGAWNTPILSNEFKFYKHDLVEHQKIDIGTHYISEAIQLLSPAKGQSFSDPNDVVFEWTPSTFANTYVITIMQANDDSAGFTTIAAFNVTAPIRLSEILSLPDIEQMKANNPAGDLSKSFVTIRGKLKSGDYQISITAKKDLEKFQPITRTDLSTATVFHLEVPD
jgi:hypothetical protein